MNNSHCAYVLFFVLCLTLTPISPTNQTQKITTKTHNKTVIRNRNNQNFFKKIFYTLQKHNTQATKYLKKYLQPILDHQDDITYTSITLVRGFATMPYGSNPAITLSDLYWYWKKNLLKMLMTQLVATTQNTALKKRFHKIKNNIKNNSAFNEYLQKNGNPTNKIFIQKCIQYLENQEEALKHINKERYDSDKITINNQYFQNLCKSDLTFLTLSSKTLTIVDVFTKYNLKQQDLDEEKLLSKLIDHYFQESKDKRLSKKINFTVKIENNDYKTADDIETSGDETDTEEELKSCQNHCIHKTEDKIAHEYQELCKTLNKNKEIEIGELTSLTEKINRIIGHNLGGKNFQTNSLRKEINKKAAALYIIGQVLEDTQNKKDLLTINHNIYGLLDEIYMIQTGNPIKFKKKHPKKEEVITLD